MVSGLLLFDKPSGWTSHDAAQFVRSRLPARPKVGHTGTLDPLATGLLILLIGQATRLQADFQKQRKAYTGRIRLGLSTETGDTEGAAVRSLPVPPLSLEALREAVRGFVGKKVYAAPAYSAIKHQGKPLYYYARKSIEVPRKEREMEVFCWEVPDYAEPELSFAMEVASGTYVRSLAEALGEKLGCGAAVCALRRTIVGAHRVEDALTEPKIRTMAQADLVSAIKPVSHPVATR